LHIDLRNWADIAVIAPLSAHSLAKIANGLCDDLLTCCIRAWDFGQGSTSSDGNSIAGKPLILAPAMNSGMWHHPLTKMQLETIKRFTTLSLAIGRNEINDDAGIIIVEPAVKTLACGETGAGALAELDDIIRAVNKCLVKRESDFSTAIINNDVSNL
jgi:phosphopantothenoylcysteine decarboxylase